MGQIRRITLFVCGLALLLLPARAAVLIHSYVLRTSLNDTLTETALTSFGGSITALGYVFAANQGLQFNSSLFTAANYSLEFTFKFDSTTGYDKIVDFHQLADDSGFYQLNGALNFFPVVTAATADFSPGTTVHVVLTRDSVTNVLAGYVNGQVRFSFVDATSLAVSTAANGNLRFFVDDFALGQSEASGGTVSSIRVFNGPLTATEVNAIFTAGQPPLAIPEPSTVALLLVGGSIVLFVGRRRRNPRELRT